MAEDSIRWMRTAFATAVAWTQPGCWQPLVDVYRTRDGWLLKYDLAGVAPEDVILTIDGNQVTIAGIRRDCCLEEGCSHFRMEISYNRFERTIELPDHLESARLATEYWRGMLLVRVERERRS
jgi:HSP20 family protein